MKHSQPTTKPAGEYTPPELRQLGTLHELTLQVCTKQLGAGDGFTFHGETIFCTSA